MNYVEKISFPITYTADEYNLTLFINSNVMGVQFSNKNDKATSTTYPAILTVNWDSINGQGQPSTENKQEDGGQVENKGDNSKSEAVVVEDEG